MRAAQEALDRADAPRAFAVALDGLRDAPESLELLQLASRICALRADARGAELFARVAAADDDAVARLELASHLRGLGAPQVAGAVLASALERAPFDAVLRSELALAQAEAGEHERVVETLALHPCLATDPGVLFQFGWSSLLAGDVDAAHGVAEQLESSRVARPLALRLRHALDRTEHAPCAHPPDARDYLYLEHGGVLLTRGPRAGAFDALELDDHVLAIIAREARRTLELVDGPTDAPLSIVSSDRDREGACARFARYFGGCVEALAEHGRVQAHVIVAADALELEPLVERLAGSVASGARLIALTMSPRRTHRVVPQLVGAFAERVRIRLDAEPAEPVRPSLAAESFVRDRRERIASSWAAVQGDEPFAPDFPMLR